MKIAVPEYQGRIAPVFDSCRRILIFDEDDDCEAMVAQEDWSTISRQRRVARLRELGIDVLLCGGISCGIEDQIHMHGIRLVAWLSGEVPRVLAAYRDGTIMDREYAMPGTHLCRSRRQKRRALRARGERDQGSTPGATEERTCAGWVEQDQMGRPGNR